MGEMHPEEQSSLSWVLCEGSEPGNVLKSCCSKELHFGRSFSMHLCCFAVGSDGKEGSSERVLRIRCEFNAFTWKSILTQAVKPY